MDKHLKIWQYAKLAQSKMRCLYKWCVAEKKATHLPLPCEDCSEWMSRLVKHLTTHKVFDLTTKIDQVQRSITRWNRCRQAGERSWVESHWIYIFWKSTIIVICKLSQTLCHCNYSFSSTKCQVLLLSCSVDLINLKKLCSLRKAT